MLFHIFRLILIIFALNIVFIVGNNSFCVENLNNTNSNSTSACNITVKLLSANEKKILEQICETRAKFFNDTSILTIKNGTFQFLKQFNCNFNLNNKIQLVWLSYEHIDKILRDSENIHDEIVAKSTNDTLSESAICAFNIRNHNCGIEFINQSSIIISHYNVLAQLLPIELVVSNINYKPWKNVTTSGYPIPMSGKIYLPNYQPTVQKLFDTIKYSYFEKISINLNEIISKENINNLEIQRKIHYNGNLVNIENDGNAHIHKSKEFTFSRILPPLSAENATIVGEWSTYIVEYSAVIEYNYGGGYKSNVTIQDAKITVKTITDIDIEFSGPILLNYSRTALNEPDVHQILPFAQNETKNVKIETNDQPMIEERTENEINTSKNGNGRVYPNFRRWFIASFILISIFLVIIFGNMLRVILKEKRIKKQRYRTGSLM